MKGLLSQFILIVNSAIITKLTFSFAGFQWEIYKKSTRIRRVHGSVTCVLHTQFTSNKKEM